MNDVRTPLSLRRLVGRRMVASLALGAVLPACGSLSPNNTSETGNFEDGDGTADTGADTMNTPTEGGGVLDDATIYDIQQGKVPDKTVVHLKDVVVTSPAYFSKDGEANFFIAEKEGGEYSGIQLYVYSDVSAELEADGKIPAVGDVLEVRGMYQEFFDYSEMTLQSAGDLTITGSGPAPTPTTVTAADIATGGAKAENFEGCLVQIENAEVTAPVVMFGQFEVDGVLQVDDQFFLPSPGPKPPMGTKFTKLIGLLTYNFEEFKLIPRTCDDYQGWDGCMVVDPTSDTNDNCSDAGGDYTIFQLQQDEVCPNTAGVTVTGAVVTSGLTFKKDGFFIEDPAGGEYSGIFVYVGANNALMVDVKPGDIVTVSGTFDEFYAASQLEATSVEITGTGTVPAAEVVDPADVATGGPKAEAYEGVLIRVENVTVAENLDFGEWTVDGGLRVDELFFALNEWTEPSPGTKYDSITGPLAYNFDNTKISPRDAADLVSTP